jgi:hypothetical protein
LEGAKVATNADELTPQPGSEDKPVVDNEQDTNTVVDNETPSDDTQEEDEQPPSIEDVAAEIGWRPKDQYKGPPENWKPAADFIRASREVQNRYAQDIKGLRSQIDVMARTTADIVKDRLEAQREELTGRYNELVEEGNAAEAFKVAAKLNKLDERVASPAPTPPSPEGQEFAERNSHWLGKDAAATARAVEITNSLAAKGVPAADQLRAAERILRLEYPEYFQNQRNGQRPAPTVHAPGSRSAGQSNRQKGFSDMPMEAQKVAKDMAERGVIANTDAYVKNYWKNAEGKR